MEESFDELCQKLNSDGQDIIGGSPEIEFIRRRLRDIAGNSSDAVVFLTGETGIGKNYAARYFRKHSPKE